MGLYGFGWLLIEIDWKSWNRSMDYGFGWSLERIGPLGISFGNEKDEVFTQVHQHGSCWLTRPCFPLVQEFWLLQANQHGPCWCTRAPVLILCLGWFCMFWWPFNTGRVDAHGGPCWCICNLKNSDFSRFLWNPIVFRFSDFGKFDDGASCSEFNENWHAS